MSLHQYLFITEWRKIISERHIPWPSFSNHLLLSWVAYLSIMEQTFQYTYIFHNSLNFNFAPLYLRILNTPNKNQTVLEFQNSIPKNHKINMFRYVNNLKPHIRHVSGKSNFRTSIMVPIKIFLFVTI